MSKPPTDPLQAYVLRLGDNALILGQQASAWCGHAPVLEEDIALANVSLDLIGQATLWLEYAAQLMEGEHTADALAFLRDERDFRNVLLVEQPNGDYGKTLVRQYLFDAWHLPLLGQLMHSTDETVAAIAAKARKEVHYHLERSRELVIALGRGTQESHGRMQAAFDDLWRFTGELCAADAVDAAMASAGVGAALEEVASAYRAELSSSLAAAGLAMPAGEGMSSGGKAGLHSEHMGPLLAQMQFLQRAYPGQSW
ncbi:MAG: 1,2-phenylacetyl-CoA epoxidase subunit PaaC [Pseudomonadota bacterium]